MNLDQAMTLVGGLSQTSKMPCYSYSLPAYACKTGSKMAEVKGTICSKCYARKGNYIWPNVKNSLQRRLDSLAHPDWLEAMTLCIEYATRKVKFFRWHDSGDLQSVEHFDNIVEIALHFPMVKFWMPTQEWNTIIVKSSHYDALPPNLIIRRSAMFFDEFPAKDSAGLHSACATHDGMAEAKALGYAPCTAPANDGQCGKCRKCWDTKVKCIVYLKH